MKLLPPRWLLGGLAVGALTWLVPSCSTELGELPARCSDGRCPDGFACIHGVCAAEGTEIPITVERLVSLNPTELVTLATPTGILVAWETYPYSEIGESVQARRLSIDGSVSAAMVLENTFEGDPGGQEPFFDLWLASENELLLAWTSGTITSDPRARISVFRVSLPAAGAEESGATSAPAWSQEVHVPSLGYGAVSSPRFLSRPDGSGPWLGYFQTIAESSGAGGGGGGLSGSTRGELAIFDLTNSGDYVSAPPACAANDDACCVAHRCLAARADQPVAVGVVAAYSDIAGATWVLDSERPSTLRVESNIAVAETQLPSLSSVLSADTTGSTYLVPSTRSGAEKLPGDPVAGPARLERADPTVSVLGQLPTMHDQPRPAFTNGVRASYLLSMESATDKQISLVRIDLASGASEGVRTIPRFSENPVAALRLVASAGKLFVVWLEQTDVDAPLRAAVFDEP